MKPQNFELKDCIYIAFEKALLDLHNDYNFEGFDKTDVSITLSWRLGIGDWVNQHQPKKVELVIGGVRKFEQVSGRKDADEVDQVTLDEIAYLTDDDWCDGPFTTPHKPEINWDWVFIFESDMWLTINAETVFARIYP